jgi:hypothetical protein
MNTPLPHRHDGTVVLGTNNAAMYIGGTVYHMFYEWPLRGRLITPEDARLIPWDALIRVERTAYGANHRATHISLHFSRTWRFHTHQFNSYGVSLVRSNRSEIVRRVCEERRAALARRLELAPPFAMGLHCRLGSESAVHLLDDGMLRLIVSFL